jgi:predicted nucleic acid-binding protein
MRAYIDSSVIVRQVFGEDDPIEDWGAWEPAIASELASIEIMRAIDRLRVLKQIGDKEFSDYSRAAVALLADLEIVRLQGPILRRAAGSFPTVISTSAAIHLATALLWQEDTGERLTFLTHDRQLRTAAQACGFSTSAP